MTRFTLTVATSCFTLTAGALGQSAQIPAPKQDRPVIVSNATIHPVDGEPIDAGYVVFDDGVIIDVGRGAPPQIADADVIDATGLHLYPGLIAAETMLGLTEIGSVDVTNDTRELGDFAPEARAAVAVNPDTDLIPVTRANGILLGLTFPQGGLISGRASIIRFDGWTWEDMAVDAEAGLVLNWPRVGGGGFGGRGRGRGPAPAEDDDAANRLRESIDRIDRFFDDAALYLKAREADPTLETDLRFEAMRATINGEKPIFVRATTAAQIESAVAWSVKRDFRIVIVGGHGADEVAPLLAKHDIPVIVSGVHRLPNRRHEAYDGPFTLPRDLHAAGVRFAIATGGESAHERNLNHMAATAAAYGLPKDEALRAVTLSAAEILGVGDRYGSLSTGKSATFILTTGDPLEITTDTLAGFIDGRNIDLGSRHKRLYSKYLEKYRQLGLLPEGAGEDGAQH
jgi:imidazolonepropionase-like amidohydrolase